MEMYLSSMSNRMNEIMKVLTIISTVFIPLTFIVGVYGMNFNTEASRLNMPELNWRLGYPLVMGGMAILAISMLAMFRRWGWIGNGNENGNRAGANNSQLPPTGNGEPPR